MWRLCERLAQCWRARGAMSSTAALAAAFAAGIGTAALAVALSRRTKGSKAAPGAAAGGAGGSAVEGRSVAADPRELAKDFDPTTLGLSPDFLLTSFSSLKG